MTNITCEAHRVRERLQAAREKDGKILDWQVPPRMGVLPVDRRRRKSRQERGQDNAR